MGHQAGVESNPRSTGRVVNTHSWPLVDSPRKPYATAATGTPMTAPSSRMAM